MALLTHRDSIKSVSPPWLQRGVAEKILYAFGFMADALGDAVTAGVKLRFPGLYSDESLALIGRERRIRRGRLEPGAVYAARLTRWLDDHRRRGGPYALLAQLWAHFSETPIGIDLVYYPSALLGTTTARRYNCDIAGAITRDTVAWNPDPDATHWARWWLFLYWPTEIASDGLWDDAGEWDPDPDEVQALGVWDSELTLQEVTDLRLVPNEWNAAHCFGRLVLLAGSAELWDYPAGTWDESGDWTETGPVSLGIG